MRNTQNRLGHLHLVIGPSQLLITRSEDFFVFIEHADRADRAWSARYQTGPKDVKNTT